LIHTGTYSSEEISGHASFFLDYISPYLGPAPIGDNHHGELGYKPRYGSAMTKDLTPFELSLCWKSYKQEYKPIVRFITDIIPSNLETTRVASLTQSLNLIETLKRVAESESTTQPLHVLPDLWKVISETFRDHEVNIHPGGDCTRCGPSSAFVGFDINASVTSGKMYWRLPSCQDTKNALELLDKAFASSALVNEYFVSPEFLSAWAQVRAHMENNPDILVPRMLSVDATTFPASRIKIYARCLFNGKKSFNEWERHLNIDGAISYPEDFRSTACNLWTSLTTNPEGWIQNRPEAGPRNCLILYELTGSSSPNTMSEGCDSKGKLSSKLYIMCQEIPRKDSVIAKQLMCHCPLAARAEILRYWR
jgi:DMATS type aromatic prenyltransferase